MARADWNERYATGDVPWDVDEPSEILVEIVHSRTIEPGRALDVGCGTGTNALWLARKGFDVVGVDISRVAVKKAEAKLDGLDLPCRFERDEPADAVYRLEFSTGIGIARVKSDREGLISEFTFEAFEPKGRD